MKAVNMHFKKNIKIFVFSLLFTFVLNANAELILGVHPYRSVDKINAAFTPLAEYLTTKLDEKVTVRVGRSYDEHVNAIGNNIIDIAFLGPTLYLELVQHFENKPMLARLEISGEPVFFGDIIVPEKSSLMSLKELKGKVFAFGDPKSTMSSKIPQYMLLQSGVSKTKLKEFMHLQSHDDVALAVLSGFADAGAVKHAVFNKYRSQSIRSLAQTPKISEHLFVARSNLSEKRVNEIRDVMLSLDDVKVLSSLKKNTTALVKVQASDYKNLKKIINTLSAKN